MITFKQFLAEDLTKIHHNDAARFYMMHCSDWKDVDKPLWRLTPGDEPIRVREPRDRQDNRYDRAYMQNWIFKQPGWDALPNRMKSIFCSTTREFEVGDEGDDGTAYAIYPVAGVKMACTDANDFNFIHPFKTKSFHHLGAGAIIWILLDMQSDIRKDNISSHFPEKIWNALVSRVCKGGEIDRSSEAWNKLDDQNQARFSDLLKEIPAAFTPERMGCRLVTPETVPVGKGQHEVWFSGKYLSVPRSKHSLFANAVEKLQNGEELPDVPPKRVVKRAQQK